MKQFSKGENFHFLHIWLAGLAIMVSVSDTNLTAFILENKNSAGQVLHKKIFLSGAFSPGTVPYTETLIDLVENDPIPVGCTQLRLPRPNNKHTARSGRGDFKAGAVPLVSQYRQYMHSICSP